MRYLSFIAAVLFIASAHAQTASTSASTNANGAAQAAGTTGQATGSASAAGQASAQGAGSSASAAEATNMSAELTKKIDTKNAKVGDEVVAHTTSAARLSDGTKLPKGTRLLGKVTDVHAKSAEEKTSRLAFAFDRAVLKDGSILPIRATVMSLSSPVSAAAMAENDDSMSVGAAPAPIMTGGGRASGGGLVGGALHGAGNAVGNTASGVGSTAGSALHTVSGAGEMAVNGTERTAASAAGQVTNLPGVSFSSDSSASQSAVLNANGRNIALASGTQMTLNVSASKQ